jgi:hypothetical protein
MFLHHTHHFDYYFIITALSHPMRTKNISEAKVFIVPTLISDSLITKIYRKEIFDKRFHQRLLNLNLALGASKWFQKSNGKDHISIITAFSAENIFNCRTPKQKDRSFCKLNYTRNIASCNMIQWYEGGGSNKKYIHHMLESNRFALPSMYVSKGCNIEANKTDDLTFIGELHHKNKRCSTCNFRLRFRREGAKWVKQSKWKYSVFGHGEKCPSLSQALVGMHFPGDSPSASRLVETILSGTVPVFTTREQYEAIPNWIDWSQISFFADIRNTTLFDLNMNVILSNKTNIMSKTAKLVKNRALFDWNTTFPFDLYMLQVQKMIYFNSTIPPNAFDILF